MQCSAARRTQPGRTVPDAAPFALFIVFLKALAAARARLDEKWGSSRGKKGAKGNGALMSRLKSGLRLVRDQPREEAPAGIRGSRAELIYHSG